MFRGNESHYTCKSLPSTITNFTTPELANSLKRFCTAMRVTARVTHKICADLAARVIIASVHLSTAYTLFGSEESIDFVYCEYPTKSA